MIFKLRRIKIEQAKKDNSNGDNNDNNNNDDDDIGSDAEDEDDADTPAENRGTTIARIVTEDTIYNLADTILENHLNIGASLEVIFDDPAKNAIKEAARKEVKDILDACFVSMSSPDPAEITLNITNSANNGNENENLGADAVAITTNAATAPASPTKSNGTTEPPVQTKVFEGDDASKERLKKILGKLQRAIFREMIAKNFGKEFKEHSEYKRYQMKFDKVYNAITHRDFDFMEILGKGSFGRVIRVRKKTTGRQYALKVMSKKKILRGAESATQVTIERNVLVMCDCVAIVKPYFAFQTNRALFLALELLEGGNLLEGMEQCGGKMPVEVVRYLTAQMIIGLIYLHNLGILYRDLKPLNVMLDRRGNAVLTDMGLCVKFREATLPKDVAAISSNGQPSQRRKSLDIVKPTDLKCVGTPGYRAPELLDADKTKAGYGPSVDYWALGVTVYYISEGKAPFRQRNPSLLGPQKTPKELERETHKQEVKYPSDFPPDLVSVITGLLARDPTQRLGTDTQAIKAHQFFKGISEFYSSSCFMKCLGCHCYCCCFCCYFSIFIFFYFVEFLLSTTNMNEKNK